MWGTAYAGLPKCMQLGEAILDLSCGLQLVVMDEQSRGHNSYFISSVAGAEMSSVVSPYEAVTNLQWSHKCKPFEQP